MAAAIIRKLYDPTLIIDNLVIAFVPGSIKYSEGGGEPKLQVQTGGGGTLQNILSEDLTKKQSKVKFKFFPTAANIDFFRAIKLDLNGHVITISSDEFSRTITGAILTTDYDVGLGPDEEVEVEFVGNVAQ